MDTKITVEHGSWVASVEIDDEPTPVIILAFLHLLCTVSYPALGIEEQVQDALELWREEYGNGQ